jgi:hypothetical protein
VVPGTENVEDWEAHGTGVLEGLKPEGHLETVLAEWVALLSWRLHRVTRYETESIVLYQEKAEDDLARARRFSDHVLGAAHPENVCSHLEAKAKHRLLKRLPKLRDDKRISSLDAERILWEVTEYAEDVAEGKIDPEDLLERLLVPGVPEGANWEDYEGWTAGMVRTGIATVAQIIDEDPKELLEAATDGARREITDKERAAERGAKDLEEDEPGAPAARREDP